MIGRYALLSLSLIGGLAACSDWATMHSANDMANQPAAFEESSTPWDMGTRRGIPTDPAQDRNDQEGSGGSSP
jgi:hypothetical protein